MSRLTCRECGNTKSFSSVVTLQERVVVDGDGMFVSVAEVSPFLVDGKFRCEECWSEDIHDAEYEEDNDDN